MNIYLNLFLHGDVRLQAESFERAFNERIANTVHSSVCDLEIRSLVDFSVSAKALAHSLMYKNMNQE